MTNVRPPVGDRLRGAASRLAARPIAWLVLVAALASWPFVWSTRTALPTAPPVLATLPAFELTDQEERPFGSRELAGRVWIASFVCTRCEADCAATTARMARIQSRLRNLAPAFHLVSFSADPEHDTPALLASYARRFRASPRLWSFLTGSPAVVRQLAARALGPSSGLEQGDAGRLGALHEPRLVLVDGRGRVRGIYDSRQEGVVDAVVRDAGLLVNRGS